MGPARNSKKKQERAGRPRSQHNCEVPVEFTRRDLGVLLPALFLPGALKSDAPPAEGPTLPSATFAFDALPVHTSNGAQMRPVLKGKLATGESLEIHETTLPPGGAPHPPHRHVHSELWLVREGTVEFTVNGNSARLGPGSVGLAASNDLHGVKNPGDAPVSYFVVAIGPGAAG